MILIDANILLYAYDSASGYHRQARQAIEEAFSRPEPVRLAWVTILAFLRISTHPRMREGRFTLTEACAIVDEWLALPNVGLLEPSERHWVVLRKLLPDAQARGPLVLDAHLATLAIEHGAILWTNDRDFSRFPGVRCLNPLAG